MDVEDLHFIFDMAPKIIMTCDEETLRKIILYLE